MPTQGVDGGISRSLMSRLHAFPGFLREYSRGDTPKGRYPTMGTGQAVHITVRLIKKNQTYLAAATNLRGVMGTGKTREEALASVLAAIRHQRAAPSEENRSSS